MTTCSRPHCDNPLYCMELCRRHYIKAWRARAGEVGKYRRIDPAPALKHLRALRELGWTWPQISGAARLPLSTIYNVYHRKTMSLAIAEAVLSVPLREVMSPGQFVDPTGTLRRIEALNFLGWPRSVLSIRLGMGRTGLSKHLTQDRVTYRTAYLVRRLYEELHNTKGPNEQVALRAERSGFHPPFAWDYVDIDDPKAKPYGGFREAA